MVLRLLWNHRYCFIHARTVNWEREYFFGGKYINNKNTNMFSIDLLPTSLTSHSRIFPQYIHPICFVCPFSFHEESYSYAFLRRRQKTKDTEHIHPCVCGCKYESRLFIVQHFCWLKHFIFLSFFYPFYFNVVCNFYIFRINILKMHFIWLKRSEKHLLMVWLCMGVSFSLCILHHETLQILFTVHIRNMHTCDYSYIS